MARLNITSQKEESTVEVSVVLPTLNEATNLQVLIPQLGDIFDTHHITYEIIIVDDDSKDETNIVSTEFGKKFPIKLFSRKQETGLGSAILKGLELAQGTICIVMDADLSHPTEAIPDMIEKIKKEGLDLVIGSRYLPGGKIKNWPWSRSLASRFAIFCARGLTPLSDPTSGFMAVKKELLAHNEFTPASWKIPLEIAAKTNCKLGEVPIVFSNRKFGQSKLSMKTGFQYLAHLVKLYLYKLNKKFFASTSHT